MKRAVTVAILIAVFFVLQSTVMPVVELAGITPNLLIILVASTGYFRGKTGGLITGFFCGLLNDLFFSPMLGFYALVYMCIGYLCGYANREFFGFDFKLPILLTAVADLLYGLVVYWCLFMMRGRMNFLFYFRKVILPELVYTCVAALLVYRLLYLINARLDKEEKRRDHYFV